MKDIIILISFALINLVSKTALAEGADDLEESKSFLTNSISGFEENKGHFSGADASNVNFVSKSKGMPVFLLKTLVAYQFTKTNFPGEREKLDLLEK